MQKAFLKIVDENQGIINKVCKMYRYSGEDHEDLYQEIVHQLWKLSMIVNSSFCK